MTAFGVTSKGLSVEKYTLSTGDLTVSFLTLGAAMHEVRLRGVDHSLTLTSDDLSNYETTMRHHGTLIGPVANRISPARVTLDGMTYELERNQDGRIHLHSGAGATHRQVWAVEDASETRLAMALDLIDGACGLPGNRKVRVVYEVEAPATLRMTVTGTTDAKTVMNFANHSYWNLDGSDRFDGHVMTINADHYLPTDQDNVPTGDITPVAGSAMDFRTRRNMVAGEPALDHNFCLNGWDGTLQPALTLTGKNGVSLDMATDQRGLQIYDCRKPNRPGRGAYEGLALEAQGWPNAPHNAAFPSIEVTPASPYNQVTEWRLRKG